MSSSGFYRELLTENPAMLAQMIVFNRQRKAKTVPLPDTWAAKLTAFPDTRAALEKTFHERRSASDSRDEGYWSFVNPSERLVLLPREDLARLGKMSAAALLADRLSVTLLQADVRAAKAFLGEDVYHWALYRGRFLPGTLSRSVGAVLPDRQLIPQLMILSRGVLESVRAQWPEALRQKSAPLFASVALPLTAPTSEDETLCRGLWYLMKKIILQEFDKKWTPFFN